MNWTLAGIFLLFLFSPALALEDTPENRYAQAERYLEAVPPAEMMADMADKVAKTLPIEMRADFKEVMTDTAARGEIADATRKALVKVFSADELKALADFYATPVAKSAMRKMGNYMAELMPTIQRIMIEDLKRLKERMDQQKSREN